MKSKAEVTHEQIQNTALAMIRKYGFSHVSIDAIAKEVGISRSTFYNHFKSKEQLISEYFDSIMAFPPEKVAWVYDAPTYYERAVRVQLAYLLRSKDDERLNLYNVHHIEWMNHPSAERLKYADPSRALLLPLIRQAQNAGEILSPESAERLCDAAIVLNWGNLFMWSISDASFNRIDTHIKTLETLFNVREDLRGIDRLYSLHHEESCL